MSRRADRDWLVEYLAVLWSDIHYNREQDWRIIQGPFISLITSLVLETLSRRGTGGSSVTLALFALTLGMSIAGLLITYRHRKLFTTKIKIIKCIERELGLDVYETILEHSNTVFKVSYILLSVYNILIAITTATICYIICGTLLPSITAGIALSLILTLPLTLNLHKLRTTLDQTPCPKLRED